MGLVPIARQGFARRDVEKLKPADLFNAFPTGQRAQSPTASYVSARIQRPCPAAVEVMDIGGKLAL